MPSIRIHPLTPDDLDFAMRLKDEAGWNQTRADWLRLLGLDPSGCFLALGDGVAAGTATAMTWGSIGWVGMVLVERERRRQGIGAALLARAVDHLRSSRRCLSVRLDATPLGKTLYERAGFRDEYRLERRERAPRRVDGPTLAPIEAHDLDDLAVFDRAVFDDDRSRLLRSFAAQPLYSALVRDGAGSVRGYLLARPGSRAGFIGPWIASDPSTASYLLRAALKVLGDQPLFADVPLPNDAAAAITASEGFATQRPFVRMALGPPGREDLTRIFGSAGPEFG